MKKHLFLFLIFVLLMGSSSIAKEEIEPSFIGKDDKFKKSGEISINDYNIVVSDVMTYEEVLLEISRDNNISVENVKDNLLKRSSDIKEEISIKASSNTYRTITKRFQVTSVYKPELKFYCRTSEGGTMWGIKEVININMNRIYNSISKQFTGTIFCNLEDAGTIYYTIDGDFYNFGTTTVDMGGSVSIGVGVSGSTTFSISEASNYYATVWTEGRYKIG